MLQCHVQRGLRGVRWGTGGEKGGRRKGDETVNGGVRKSGKNSVHTT